MQGLLLLLRAQEAELPSGDGGVRPRRQGSLSSLASRLQLRTSMLPGLHRIWFPFAVDTAATLLNVGFAQAMMEPMARNTAGMSAMQIGTALLLMSLTYIVVSPAIGRVRHAYLLYM